jgi:hypothetical protein
MTACAPLQPSQSSSSSRQIDPYTQAQLDDAKSLIGKKIWVTGPAPVICDAPTCHGELDGGVRAGWDKDVGPLYVQDVLPADLALYLVVNTDEGTTKYLYFLSSRPSKDVLFEDPKIKTAREKAACKKEGGVSIGMSEAKVLASCWGKPRKKNITEGVGGRHEQWVYGNNYLYFEDGILTSIQTSR